MIRTQSHRQLSLAEFDGTSVFDVFHTAVVDAVESRRERSAKTVDTKAVSAEAETKAEGTSDDDNGSDDPPPPATEAVHAESTSEMPARQGKLILDATVAPQAIRYPTDLSLLNEARQFSEDIIDRLFAHTTLAKKPRTYRQQARKAFLAVAKKKRPGAKVLRRGIKQQLQYLRRNLGHIETLLTHFPEGQPLPLPDWLLRRYWVIPHLFAQQWDMHRTRSKRCDDRIVSISQPWVRPIVRGKVDKPVEFGAKLSVSLTDDGIARVDHLRWDAFHEGHDLPAQVEAYRERHGVYPEVVLGDGIYGSRDNRRYLKERGIRFAGRPLGRPKKVTEANREQLKQEAARRREEHLQRIPIEGKFGQGKNGYGLSYIRAKRADTSVAWINKGHTENHGVRIDEPPRRRHILRE